MNWEQNQEQWHICACWFVRTKLGSALNQELLILMLNPRESFYCGFFYYSVLELVIWGLKLVLFMVWFRLRVITISDVILINEQLRAIFPSFFSQFIYSQLECLLIFSYFYFCLVIVKMCHKTNLLSKACVTLKIIIKMTSWSKNFQFYHNYAHAK